MITRLMKYLMTSLIAFYCLSCQTSRNPTATLQHRDYLILLSDIDIMDVDPLGNLYIVDGNERLTKCDSTAIRQFHIVNTNLGDVHSIDVGNPFKIMMFYRDQQTILLLDKTLSEIQRIQLPDWGVADITAACLAPDNAIWIFNGTKKTLVKMDDSGNAILTSDPFDMIGPGAIRPDFILDTDNYLILSEHNNPISLFNDFGNYVRDLSEIPTSFSMAENKLIYQKENRILSYDLTSQRYFPELKMTESSPQKLYAFGDHYYSVDPKGIYVISLVK
ncbi:MAG: hypothetical protein M3R25_06145 [Bacteroidota bacterium]|nr:hypothetical protein [Bacteroidota bacterium]